MFSGRYEHSIDKKGRISIPYKYREILADRSDDCLIVTNFDSCLVAFPRDQWAILEKKVAGLPQMKEEVKAFQRYFISGAVECPLDRQGRVMLPQSLRKYAGLEKEVILVGLIKKFEIWDKKRWETEFERCRDKFENSQDILGDLGI